MLKLLVDTCVWLDVAKDSRNEPLLDALELLVKRGDLELLVPRVVVDEFARNKARVVKDGTQSLSSAIRRVQEAVVRLDTPRRRGALAKRLTDLELKLPTLGEAVLAAIGRVETLLKGANIIELSDAMKARAAERALSGRAPFHRNKNAMGDALLIEAYTEAIAAPGRKGTRFAFVTHNKRDFSLQDGDQRRPHADLASLFSKVRSRYYIALADALRRVDASLVSDQILFREIVEEPRSASEIIHEMNALVDKVWYSRHQLLRQSVEAGKTMLVEMGTPPGPGVVHKDIWAGALRAAKGVEKRHGVENLGPWDDFEWGMINGKLSALRWVLGDEWDMLDT